MASVADLPSREQMLSDPDLLLHTLDLQRDCALFVRLSRAEFRAASFLDDRVLRQGLFGKWVRLERVAGFSTATPAKPLHFIFHAGHVGSTLLSRLMEEIGGILALREPLPLRTLAEAQDSLDTPASLLSPAQFSQLLHAQLALWGRGYADTQSVVVKATSTTSRLAPRLLEACAGARAVCLNLKPTAYLETLLAGENSWMDLRGHAQERQRRLQAMGVGQGKPIYAHSIGELAAHAWATETLTQKRVISAHGARIMSLDFDRMLADIGGTLRDVCAHLQLDADQGTLQRLQNSPALQQYAKAPEAPYSPALRDQVLRQARAQHSAEITKGLRWIEALARANPAISEDLAS